MAKRDIQPEQLAITVMAIGICIGLFYHGLAAIPPHGDPERVVRPADEPARHPIPILPPREPK